MAYVRRRKQYMFLCWLVALFGKVPTLVLTIVRVDACIVVIITVAATPTTCFPVGTATVMDL
ncbi:hypothetical protein E2562_020899 [Oryza meyeriana var. granulata]|uniref:Uncharacterized protein n=1 Tax=Oryza meyeriana var. granulata TaxID=110450 RepID=A0A6G1D622_9ORYZ|nr:hypothetical protein E2562_020899 [Oryza meyeriana var. granulata]